MKLILKRFLVALAVERDAIHKSIHAAVLALIFAFAFAVFGNGIVKLPRILLVEDTPFKLDWALRTVSLGWFNSSRTIPISMVEIDEGTFRAWGSPSITPRTHLATMLEVVTKSNPAAVVVDIDLSWAGDNDLAVLRKFLLAYDRSAPLIFPKRIEPGDAGTRRQAASPLDDIFAVSSHFYWAHASFETDKGGIVRQWADWLEVCTDNAARWLPSITVRLTQVLSKLPPGLDRQKEPPQRDSCKRAVDAPGQLLLIGPRLTSLQRFAMMSDVQWVVASALLDKDLDLNGAALFGNRVVFIGATHSGSGDRWLTPGGVLPGVELIANTVRFAPLITTTGLHAEVALRAVALFAFFMFAVLMWCFRGFWSIVVSMFLGLLFVAVLIWYWNYYRVFEAIEVSLLLLVEYKTAQALLDLLADYIAKREGKSKGNLQSVLTEEFAECWKKRGALWVGLTKHRPFGLGRKGRSARKRT